MPAAQYQNVFRVSKPDAVNASNNSQGYVTKTRRSRQPLSCDACRTRKLKCDRQTPCTPCSKRADASSSCNYSKSSKDGGSTPNRAPASTRTEAQLRLQKLEEMVTGLMQASPPSSTDISSLNNSTVDQRMKDMSISLQSLPKDSVSPSNGHLDSNGLERNYQGATHWTTILANIHDIQGFLDSNNDVSDEISPPNRPEAPDILFGTTQPLTRNDVLNFLPARQVIDRLVSVYFTAKFFRAPFVHSQKFLREYQAFWADPLSASFLWISMLFSILWTSSHLEALESGDFSSKNAYLIRAAQALVTGGYQKARPYSLDATLHYALCIYYQSPDDASKDGWMAMGLATRLAIKMGYHRDPSHLANITPFEGEMRRRCFFLLETFEVLLSIRHGLPAIIQEDECDTEPPRNLLDEDFDEDCKMLPPSRPSTTPTPMLYFCYKSRFVKAHKRAIRHALTVKNPSYEETMKLDAELQANDADTPPSLRLTSLDELLLDDPYQILKRMHIKFQYLQSLCVLHRKYISHDRTNPAFAHSRTTCIDAALQLLKHQADFHFASQSGGRFYKNRAMDFTLTRHDFLLAAMIICLDMYEAHNRSLLSNSKDLEAQAKKYDAIRLSNDIWRSRRHVSRDVQRASSVLAIMLSRVPRPIITAKPTNNAFLNHPALPQNSAIELNLGAPMMRSVGGFTWYSNVSSTSNQDASPEDYPILLLDATDPLNTIFDGSEDIDWGVLDQYLAESSGSSDDPSSWQIIDPPKSSNSK